MDFNADQIVILFLIFAVATMVVINAYAKYVFKKVFGIFPARNEEGRLRDTNLLLGKIVEIKKFLSTVKKEQEKLYGAIKKHCQNGGSDTELTSLLSEYGMYIRENGGPIEENPYVLSVVHALEKIEKRKKKELSKAFSVMEYFGYLKALEMC